MKLLVGVPSLDFVHVDFVKCLTALVQRLKDDGVRFEVFLCNGTLAHVARDRVACKAINEGFTHVLWLDADMIFTPDILEDLSFSGHDFVTGLAASRRPPYMLCSFRTVNREKIVPFELDDLPQETVEIEGCGLACVLISTEILREVQFRYKSCFIPMDIFGEDLAFCVRAREMGHRIYLEPTVRVGHIGHNAVWPEDHKRYMQQLREE